MVFTAPGVLVGSPELGGALYAMRIDNRVLNNIQRPRRSAAPPPVAWKLRLLLESVVNFSVWFAFNVVCGGSDQILMG